MPLALGHVECVGSKTQHQCLEKALTQTDEPKAQSKSQKSVLLLVFETFESA
jgi:hypothetical protein